MRWIDARVERRSRCWMAAAVAGQVLAAGAAFAGCGDRPGTPTDIKLEPREGALNITWRDTTRKGEGSCHDIEIKRQQNGDLSKSVTGGVCLSGATAGSYLVQNIGYGQQYCVRMKARDHAGTQGCVSKEWSATVCASSGYPPFKTGPATPAGPTTFDYRIEQGIDRPGNDIERRVIRGGLRPDTRVCQSLCDQNASCAGWTYVRAIRPTGQRPQSPICYMKKGPLPPATPNPCCTSGVKITGPIVK